MSSSTSTLGLVKPAYSETADVMIINDNMDLLDAEAGKVRGNFSENYDDSASYAVGDWCLHEGVLYRCNTAIASGGEDWDSSHWDAEKITDYLAQGTMRPVPMAIGVSDWTGATAPYTATVDSVYVTATSIDLVVWDDSITNLNAHISSAKKTGNGGMTFTTSKKPDSTVMCTVLIWDNNDGKVPVLIESTVIGIDNGGTGQSTLAGAKQALGVTNLESEVSALNGKLTDFVISEYKDKETGLPTISANSQTYVDVSITKTGYKALGILGITGSTTNGLTIQEFFLISDATARVYLRNATGSAITPTKITVGVLYVKN